MADGVHVRVLQSVDARRGQVELGEQVVRRAPLPFHGVEIPPRCCEEVDSSMDLLLGVLPGHL